MAAIRRVHSSGPPPASLMAHRAGAFIALGAVGISLGAVYAWTRSKRPALEAPSSVLVAKKKPSKERRSRGKRQKSRPQAASGGEGGGPHESSEEDLPAATDDAVAPPPPEPEPEEGSQTAAAREQAMDVEPMKPMKPLESAAAATRASADAARPELAPAADAESMTGAGVTCSLASAEPSGETASEGGWIPVERKQRKGRRAAAATAAAEALTGESQGPEDTKDVLQPEADEPPPVAKPQPPPVEVVGAGAAEHAAEASPEPSPDASDEARRLRREAKKKRKAEQAAAKADVAAGAAAAGGAAAEARAGGASAKAPLPRFAPPRPSWADEVDEEEDARVLADTATEPYASSAVEGHVTGHATGHVTGHAMDEAACAAEQVAAELDAAERDADDASIAVRGAESEERVEWVEVKKRGGRGKK